MGCLVSQKIASNYRNVYLTIRVSGATAFQFDGHTVNNWIYVVCTTVETHPSSSSNTHTYPSSTTSMSYPTLQTFGENGRNQPTNASLCCWPCFATSSSRPIPPFLSQLTKAIRSLEKEAKSSATLRDEVDKLRSWKDSKAAEVEDLMEKVSRRHPVLVVCTRACVFYIGRYPPRNVWRSYSVVSVA